MLSSGYSIGFLAAVVLHLLLPMEQVPTKDVTDVKAGLYDPTAPRSAESMIKYNVHTSAKKTQFELETPSFGPRFFCTVEVWPLLLSSSELKLDPA